MMALQRLMFLFHWILFLGFVFVWLNFTYQYMTGHSLDWPLRKVIFCLVGRVPPPPGVGPASPSSDRVDGYKKIHSLSVGEIIIQPSWTKNGPTSYLTEPLPQKIPSCPLRGPWELFSSQDLSTLERPDPTQPLT